MCNCNSDKNIMESGLLQSIAKKAEKTKSAINAIWKESANKNKISNTNSGDFVYLIKRK